MKLSRIKLIVLGLLLFVILLVIIALKTASNQNKNTPSPTASPSNEIYSPKYQSQVPTIAGQEQPLLQKDALVSKFINTLPYTGTYIQVAYDISTNEVTVRMPQDNLDEGNKEFDGLLQKNGIQQRSWIRDLKIVTE